MEKRVRRRRTECVGVRREFREMLSQRRLEYPLRRRMYGREEACLSGAMADRPLQALGALARLSENWYSEVKFGRRRRYTTGTSAEVFSFFAAMRRVALQVLTMEQAAKRVRGEFSDRLRDRYLELAAEARRVRGLMVGEGSVTLALSAGDMETLKAILKRSAELIPSGSRLLNLLA